MMRLRDYTFLGTTQSLCPECLALVPAKIVARENRVYFRKRCERHGEREDFVCSDAGWFDRMEYSLPGKIPAHFGVEPRLGCPYDCGLCTEHEQHTCIGVLEITESCNLTCPMCYASSAPGGRHLPAADCRRAIDALVRAEGRAEVLQLSGGEPTIHPDFLDIFRYACQQPIDIVMINTNGIRLARDDAFLAEIAELRKRCEIYLQLDGLSPGVHGPLRGEELLETKLRAVERLGEAGLRTILVATMQAGVNDADLGPLVRFGLARPWVTGISFQPATYVGRHVLPEALERRITFPDIVRGIVAQTGGLYRDADFLPLPCAHPNAHTLSYAYRRGDSVVPLANFIDIENHLDLLANGITFNRQSARQLIDEFLARRTNDCGCDGGVPAIAEEFFRRALALELSPADVFRITTTSFMDAYNFDLRQLMKSCVHHILPSGHLIPFCAYNLLYRNGKVPLPPLTKN